MGMMSHQSSGGRQTDNRRGSARRGRWLRTRRRHRALALPGDGLLPTHWELPRRASRAGAAPRAAESARGGGRGGGGGGGGSARIDRLARRWQCGSAVAVVHAAQERRTWSKASSGTLRTQQTRTVQKTMSETYQISGGATRLYARPVAADRWGEPCGGGWQ